MYQIIRIKPLAQKVLAVAAHDGRDWVVFIDAVPGVCHEKEAQAVLEHGDKTSETLAKFLFPGLADLYAWRD